MARFCQHEILEESVRKVEVVVLAGVHDDRLGPVGFLKSMIQRRDLHEVRTGRRDEVDEFHGMRLDRLDRSER